MRVINNKSLINQASDFYRETRYAPTNYDALFHTDYFSSPVTIRKKFGSWENYLSNSFNIMAMEYENKMFYGGYNRNYTVTLPDVIDPTVLIGTKRINLLGDLTYDNISAKEVWVLKNRWESIIKVIVSMQIPFTIIPAEKRFLTPYVLIGEDYAIGSFDTPHIPNHYKRTTKVIEYLNKNYGLLNLNGVKKNHIQKAIERLLE